MDKPDVEKVSLRMEMKWTEAESRIIQDIARRIRKSGKITSTADYQINRLVELGRSTEEIEKILQEALGATREEMYKLYDDVSNWQYVRNKDLYEQINREFIPPEENEWLKQISSAAKEQTEDALINLSQSYGFAVMMGTRKVFMPFAQYYQKYVDEAIMDIISGGFDYNTVIRRVVTQMTNSGLRTVDYASGHSNRTPVAVRRAVLTGVAQITGKIAEQNAANLGTEYYEVDWHSGARPEHRIWQGKVYSYKELETVCGLGTVTGLHGANCYHDYYPFVPGVSERLYTDEWLEEQNRKEEQTKDWNGKDYNLYEQTQKMRQMETSMRAQREKVDALKAAKADVDEITIARAKYQAQLNEYSQFCKKMGLKEQRERIYYDMRGRIAPGKISAKTTRGTSVTDKLFEKSKLSRLMGINKDKIEFSKIDEKSKKSVYNGIKKVFAKFPQLKGYTKEIIYDPNLDAIASSDSLGGRVKLSAYFTDYEKLKNKYEKYVKMQFSPAGTNADSVIVHEMGHQLDGYLTLRGIFGGNISKYGVTRTSLAVKREVLTKLGYYDYLRAERESWRRMGYSGKALNEAVEFSGKEFVTKHISEYAYKNEREFFAECFSEYMTSKKPREAAKIFGEILEEIMEGLE